MPSTQTQAHLSDWVFMPSTFALLVSGWMHTTLAMHTFRPGWYDPDAGMVAALVFVQSALRVVSVWMLSRNLTQRIFVLGRA